MDRKVPGGGSYEIVDGQRYSKYKARPERASCYYIIIVTIIITFIIIIMIVMIIV